MAKNILNKIIKNIFYRNINFVNIINRLVIAISTITIISILCAKTLLYISSNISIDLQNKLLLFLPFWYENNGRYLLAIILSMVLVLGKFNQKLINKIFNTIKTQLDNQVVIVVSIIVMSAVVLFLERPQIFIELTNNKLWIKLFPYIRVYVLGVITTLLISLSVKKIKGFFIFLKYKMFGNKSTKISVLENSLSDEPITDESNDFLGRGPVVDTLYGELVNLPFNDSFVISVDGAWGEGKTSILNLLEKRLKNDSNFIIVKFDPWFYENEHQLMKNFLFEFEKAVNDNYFFPSFKRYFGKYKKIVIPCLEYLLPIKLSLGEFFSNDSSLDEIKKHIDKVLSKINKKIIIIVDNIDRCENAEEILQTLKAIKLLSNFKNTRFVLALDQIEVKRVIGKEGSFTSNYLEKIIQKSYSLPKIVPEDIDNFIENSLDNIVESFNYSKKEKKLFSKKYADIYQRTLKKCLTTLRKAKRYLNSLKATLSYEVKNEISLYDIFTMEIIRVFYPKVFYDIRDNPWYYMNYTWGELGDYYMTSPLPMDFKDGATTNIEVKNHIDEVLKEYKVEERDIILDILVKVFIPVEKAYQKQNYDFNGMVEDVRAEKRITHPTVFRRYFTLKTDDKKLLDSEIEILIKKLNKSVNPNTILDHRLAKWFEEGKLLEALELFHIFLKKVSIRNSQKIIISLFQFADTLPDEIKNNPNRRDEFAKIYYICRDLIEKRIKNKISVNKIVTNLIKNGPRFFAIQIVDNVAIAESTNVYRIRESVDRNNIIKLLRQRLNKFYIKDKRNIFEEDPNLFNYVIYRWVQLGDAKQKIKVNNYLFKLFKLKPIFLLKSLKGFLVFWPEDPKIEYKEIEKIYELDKLFNFLKKIDIKNIDSAQKKVIELFNKVYLKQKEEVVEADVSITSTPPLIKKITG